jgi:hypothetical protein
MSLNLIVKQEMQREKNRAKNSIHCIRKCKEKNTIRRVNEELPCKRKIAKLNRL